MEQNIDRNRVVFHSAQDMSSGYYLHIAETILRSFDPSSMYVGINDIIELNQIVQYIEAELYLKTWSGADITLFKETVNQYNNIVGKFISSINDDNIIVYYNQLNIEYYKAFWRLICNFKAYKRISKDVFTSMLSERNYDIHEILKQQQIVSYYANEIRAFLINYSKSAELLLAVYEKSDESMLNTSFPRNLTVHEKEEIISKYLDSDCANLNYVRLIPTVRNNNNFTLSDKVRLKAKKCAKIMNDKIIYGETVIENRLSVQFNLDQEEPKLKNSDSYSCNFSYGLSFIKQHNDPVSLFYNFVYLFEYLDRQYRIRLISKSKESVLMDIFEFKSINTYSDNHIFKWKDNLSLLQIKCYSLVLNKLGNPIESVISYFLNEYLFEKYSVNYLRIKMPSNNSSYLEKVRMVAPEFESVLKKYKLLVTEGEIDLELLSISSTPCPIKDIPSLVSKKYIYLNDDCQKEKYIQHCLFSDQASLSYLEKFDRGYQCLYDLITNENVKFEDFKDYQKESIQKLIDENYLFFDDDMIKLGRIEEIEILKDLYLNEFICYWKLPTNYQIIADMMESLNIINYGNTLFSKQEQSYFNYYLNKSEFTNGLDLRNQYLHGTQYYTDNEDAHETAYYMFLKLLILIICKIDQDLFLKTNSYKLNRSNL